MESLFRSKIFAMLSFLLEYPDVAWRQSLDSLRAELQSLSDDDVTSLICHFITHAEQVNVGQWQAEYVRTFDFSKKTNLYLTYEQHGDERERGQALVALKQRYAQAGFALKEGEIADFLPLMLEFAAITEQGAGEALLLQYLSSIEAICDGLVELDSPYHALFQCLLQTIRKGGMAHATV